MYSIGQTAVVGLISHIIFIVITWYILQGINFDPIIRKGRAIEARIFLLFIAILIGSSVSRFFLEILQWSRDLLHLY